MNDLLIHMLHCGQEEARDTSYFWDNLRRANRYQAMVIQRTRSGRGFIEKGGRRLEAASGQAMLFIHGEDSRYGFPPGSEELYAFDYIGFAGSAALPLFQELLESEGPVIDLPNGSEAAMKYEWLLQKSQGRQFRDRYEAASLIYEMLTCLFRLGTHLREEIEPEVAAWEWIQSNFDQALNIQELADRFNVSREHLTRRFARRYRLAPGATLRELRLQRSQQLVATTRLSLGEIAQACGFQDSNVLCRAYRQKFGISPIASRQR